MSKKNGEEKDLSENGGVVEGRALDTGTVVAASSAHSRIVGVSKML